MKGKSWIHDAIFSPPKDGVYLVAIGFADNRRSWYRETRSFDAGRWLLNKDDEGQVLFWSEIPEMPDSIPT